MTSNRPALAYVVHSLNPGGTERLVLEMSLAFAAEFDLQVLCLDEPGTWAETLRRRHIPVHCLWRQPGLDLALPLALARHFRQAGTQLIHAHQCTPWFYSALARAAYPAPRLLFEEHGRFYPETRNVLRSMVNRTLIARLTHDIIAVSRDVRDRLEAYEGLEARRISVIYNGVAPERSLSAGERTELRRELGLGPDDFVVGTVGRFDPIKNLPMLVESLGRAAADAPQMRGLLVGAGPTFDDVRSLIGRLGLSDRIILTGFRNDARRVTQCMDLFVLSSLSEGTSMALLEAVAAGVPAAVTAVGGNPDVVAEGAGWLVPSGSIKDLTRAIVEAFRTPARRQEYAARARRRFEETFTFERMLGSYLERYRQLLGGGCPRDGRARGMRAGPDGWAP